MKTRVTLMFVALFTSCSHVTPLTPIAPSDAGAGTGVTGDCTCPAYFSIAECLQVCPTTARRK